MLRATPILPRLPPNRIDSGDLTDLFYTDHCTKLMPMSMFHVEHFRSSFNVPRGTSIGPAFLIQKPRSASLARNVPRGTLTPGRQAWRPAAARELRDRYLEELNAGRLEAPAAAGKYDLSRQIEPRPLTETGMEPKQTPLLAA